MANQRPDDPLTSPPPIQGGTAGWPPPRETEQAVVPRRDEPEPAADHSADEGAADEGAATAAEPEPSGTPSGTPGPAVEQPGAVEAGPDGDGATAGT